jgi:hypothetical protein
LLGQVGGPFLALSAKGKARNLAEVHGDEAAQLGLLKTALDCLPRLMPSRMTESEVTSRRGMLPRL